jgi:hypothetical protein
MFENLGKTQRKLEENTIKMLRKYREKIRGKSKENQGKNQGQTGEKRVFALGFSQVFPWEKSFYVSSAWSKTQRKPGENLEKTWAQLKPRENVEKT